MAWFKCATRRPISTNTGGPMSPTNLGLILHHAVANGSLYSFFNNPVNKVSAHFWVAKDGTIEQYVDTSIVAWHARDLNINYIGVETEGCVTAPNAEPLTESQQVSLATLYAEGMATHNWANQLCEAKGQRGFGYHRLPGSQNGPGGSFPTACPCDVRKDMRQSILNRILVPTPKPPTPTPPHPEIEDLVPLTCMLDKDGNNLIYGVDDNGNLWEITNKPADPNTPMTKTYRWSNVTANGQNGQRLSSN